MWIFIAQGEAHLTPVYVVRSSGYRWQTIEVHIGRIPNEYQIIIEAVPIGEVLSGAQVAVDSIETHYCSQPNECFNIPSGYFACDNKACVPDSSICDFVDNCGDFSDETACSKLIHL